MKLSFIVVLVAAIMGSAFGATIRKAAQVEVRNKDGTPPAKHEGQIVDDNLIDFGGPDAKIGGEKLLHRESGLCVGFDSLNMAKLVSCTSAPYFYYNDYQLQVGGYCLSLKRESGLGYNQWVKRETCDGSSRQHWYGVRVTGWSYAYRLQNRLTKMYIDDVQSGDDIGYLDVMADGPFDADQMFLGIDLEFFSS